MSDYRRLRGQTVDKAILETSRLEKRLTRLTQLLANSTLEQIQTNTNKRWSIPWGQNDQRKALEQSVVTWQDDQMVSRCPYCQQEFSGYTFRRHHCRTCGKVVCGDPVTSCSTEIGLNVAAGSTNATPETEKITASRQVAIDVRLCKECKAKLFDKRDFVASATQATPFTRAYENLVQFERGIRLLLPKFQKHLSALQDPDRPPLPATVVEASKVRQKLMESFGKYDIAARRIRDMPSASPTQLKLQKAIYQQSSNFLHLYMLPLKTLPRILKHATPHGANRLSGPGASRNGSRTPTPNIHPSTSALASVQFNARTDSSSVLSSNSSQISALEVEEKSLRDRLIVLEEQRFFVQEMMASASKRRKFDELEALRGNELDLGREIDNIQGQLAQLDFEGAYTGTGD